MNNELSSVAPKIVLNPDKLAANIAERQRINEIIATEYDKAVEEIVALIPEHLSESDQLATLYAIFLERMKYDFDRSRNVNEDGIVLIPDSSRLKYRQVIDGQDTYPDGKEAAMLSNFGVCANFSAAFTDVAIRLEIPCDTVVGKTRVVTSINGNEVELGHAWNQTVIDGEIKNIDVTYGLFVRAENIKKQKGIAPELSPADFFLVDSDTLRQNGPHHDFKDSANLLEFVKENN